MKYFEKSEKDWKIRENIRNMVEFQSLNLLEPYAKLQPFDLIFCRNVLIYFELETKKQILTKLKQVLPPDGYLFLGAAETTMNVDNSFKRISAGKCSCYQKGAG